MNVLILAAGIGSRLGMGVPKILVKVAGKTILCRHVESLARLGIEPSDITVVTGFRAGDVASACESSRVKTLYNPNWNHPGTFSSFSLFTPSGDSLLLLHGDLLWEADLGSIALSGSGDIVVPVDPRNRALEEAMKAEIRENRILHMSKNLPLSRSAGESMGMFFIQSHQLLHRHSAYLADDPSSNFDDAVNHATGYSRVEAVVTDKFVWEEIDTPEDLEAAKRKFS